ncbi:maker119 [Drosophila busckii]|uniref:Dap n=2 Tax=Drosophila busckii TaxID=30019 RepID=A0A0M4EEF1_DROBS|nr:dap [Drosophila busckii]ALC42452.1 maker119 [Drosophila busckii]
MSASPAMGRSSPCGRQLDRIKRNLFGTSHTELAETKTNTFSPDLELATRKWGFDFRAGRPLAASPSYIWERVSTQESNFAPQMYTLTRAAHVRPAVGAAITPSVMDALLNERADRENLANSSLDSNTDTEYDSQDESLPLHSSASTSAAAAAALAASAAVAANSACKRQLKITEFMKERKRLAQAPKKLSPAKRMRSSLNSSSSSSSIITRSSSSASSSSLETQLGYMLKRTRHN